MNNSDLGPIWQSWTAICHIPRTAGTSLKTALNAYGCISEVAGNRYHADVSCAGKFELARKRRIKKNIQGAERTLFWDIDSLRQELKSHLVIGHIAVADFERAGATKIFVTVREPRVRLLSWYAFETSQTDEWHLAYGPNGNVSFGRRTPDFDSWITRNAGAHGQIAKMGRKRRAVFGDKSSVLYLWPDELDHLGSVLTGDPDFSIPKTNASHAWSTLQTKHDRVLLEAATKRDSHFLAKLMDTGDLSFRSVADLDFEYESYVNAAE